MLQVATPVDINCRTFLLPTAERLFALKKTCFFVIPAELADRIDNLIHLPQFHAVHQPVKLSEIFFDLNIIQAVTLTVSLV